MPRAPSIYYSGCSVFGTFLTFECIDQFRLFLLVIVCVGAISKLQLHIWSQYGPQAEIIFFFTESSPLFLKSMLWLDAASRAGSG
jgi:hypothetical protein